jgi:hypothetical protein
MVYTYYPVPTDATGYPSPDRRLLYQPLKAPAYVYTFKQPEHDSIINTEVLIIGSGAGGGVAASVLSRGGDADAVANTGDLTPADGGKRDDSKRVSHDGLKCLVVEKGIYAPTGERCRNQGEGFKELYQSGGVMVSESGSISVLAGALAFGHFCRPSSRLIICLRLRVPPLRIGLWRWDHHQLVRIPQDSALCP